MKKLALTDMVVMATMIFSACAPSNDTLTVNDAWARPAPKGPNGAVYFIIQNDTAYDDALIGASTDIASSAEAHMSMVNEQTERAELIGTRKKLLLHLVKGAGSASICLYEANRLTMTVLPHPHI